jgi:stage II sporulation protein M
MKKKRQVRRKNMKRAGVFRESWDYLKESKKYIYFVFYIFLAGSLIGFLFAPSFNDILQPLIKELVSKTEGLSSYGLIWFIFSNNVSSSFTGLIFGSIAGIFPVFSALVNGLVVGYVYSLASSVEGFGVIWQLLPHGVFELPAAFVSLGLGIKLGMSLFSKNRKKTFINRLLKSVKAFITIVLPLLAIAAIIEGLLIAFAP